VKKITGTTPPAVPCPNSLCDGKGDGNFEYHYYNQYRANYFLQCSNGLAYCQACFPLSLEFSEPCNQCLYARTGKKFCFSSAVARGLRFHLGRKKRWKVEKLSPTMVEENL